MGKLGCKCGHTIRDNTDDLPYKGRVLRDQDDEPFFGEAARELALFAEAVASGRREEWIGRNFLPLYPRDVPDEGVISDFLSGLQERLTTQVYECEVCGRLWVQGQPGSSRYVPYSPDDGAAHGALASVSGSRDEAEPSAA